MSTPFVRALLATIVLLAVVAATVLTFLFGPQLTDVQLALLTMLLTALVSKLGSAFEFYFDGLPPKAAADTAKAGD